MRPRAPNQRYRHGFRLARKPSSEENMTESTWTAPEACEVCVGMEVTSYMSAAL
jgi:coenzyme PQQ precursor peptide PqqA